MPGFATGLAVGIATQSAINSSSQIAAQQDAQFVANCRVVMPVFNDAGANVPAKKFYAACVHRFYSEESNMPPGLNATGMEIFLKVSILLVIFSIFIGGYKGYKNSYCGDWPDAFMFGIFAPLVTAICLGALMASYIGICWVFS